VSYNEKHNEANGEDNRDGESHNRSWNCGVEGPTEDVEIFALRERQKRNILTTLVLSQGVPMISHGDELGRTQQGNNNVYCQDNELSWVDWEDARAHDVLTGFVTRLTRLRAEHPIFRRQRFFQGRPIRGTSLEDIAWLRPDGAPMSGEDWDTGRQSLMIYLNGHGIPDRDELGQHVIDDSFLLLFNAHHEDLVFTLPDEAYGQGWQSELDTADPLLADDRRRYPQPGSKIDGGGPVGAGAAAQLLTRPRCRARVSPAARRCAAAPCAGAGPSPAGGSSLRLRLRTSSRFTIDPAVSAAGGSAASTPAS
jgi:glycogen operon protein